jgi:hypothetical protein
MPATVIHVTYRADLDPPPASGGERGSDPEAVVQRCPFTGAKRTKGALFATSTPRRLKISGITEALQKLSSEAPKRLRI